MTNTAPIAITNDTITALTAAAESATDIARLATLVVATSQEARRAAEIASFAAGLLIESMRDRADDVDQSLFDDVIRRLRTCTTADKSAVDAFVSAILAKANADAKLSSARSQVV